MPRKQKKQREKQKIKENVTPKEEVIDSSKPRIINQLVGTLGSALEDEPEEIDDLLLYRTESENETIDSKKEATGKKRVYISLGIITVVLSVIGAFTCIGALSGFIGDIVNQTALKNEFATFVFPVVITDPPTFESVENLQSLTVISSSIWKIILNGDNSKYEKNMGMMTIPAIDVEASARSIFGYGYDIIHRTIEGFDITFEYNEEKNSYIVPEKPRNMTYMPGIEEINNDGETFNITVNYIAPSTMSLMGVEYESQPIKTMLYSISRTKDKMTIISIEYVLDSSTHF